MEVYDMLISLYVIIFACKDKEKGVNMQEIVHK